MKKIEANDKFLYKGEVCHYSGIGVFMVDGKCAYDEGIILGDIINTHPGIKRIQTWTDKDKAEARAIKMLYPGIHRMQRDSDGDIRTEFDNNRWTYIYTKALESLTKEMGFVTVEEILGE